VEHFSHHNGLCAVIDTGTLRVTAKVARTKAHFAQYVVFEIQDGRHMRTAASGLCSAIDISVNRSISMEHLRVGHYLASTAVASVDKHRRG
jgi:hypothetical protein